MLRSLALVAAITGCAAEPRDAAELTQATLDCDDWYCGSNNPWADTYFHELNEDGVPNTEGFAIVDFIQNNLAYRLDVLNGKLRGTRQRGRISGADLVGATIHVSHGARTFAIKVNAVDSVPYWANNGLNPIPTIETYQLTYIDAQLEFLPAGYWRDLCHNPPADDSPDRLGLGSHLALLFEGDRVSPAAKADYAIDPTGKWFNIGCAGSPLAKMYLSGHAEVAKVDGYTTTLTERTTLLKVFAADYCGHGTPYTVAGQPLGWSDHRGWMSITGTLSTTPLEARWTSAGAACIFVPRAMMPNTPANAAFPNVQALIANECTIPVCEDRDWNHNQSTHLVTANTKPVP